MSIPFVMLCFDIVLDPDLHSASQSQECTSWRKDESCTIVTSGKCAALLGGGELLGEEDSPFPSMFGTMMKYLWGSRPLPGPISQSLSVCLPEYHVG